MESSIKINLQNEAGKSIGLYIINRVTVADAIRRNKLFDLVKTEDETARGQYFNAISLICSLCDEKGNLLYPEKDYPELTAVEEIFKMDFELYQVLSEAFLDINPIAPTLSAKKKRNPRRRLFTVSKKDL